MPAASPYATALALNHAAPTFVPNEDDQARVQSYQTYEDIYWNVDTAFEAILRDADGEEVSRRYVPGARTLIEGTNRYLAKSMAWVGTVPADVTLGEEDQAATLQMLQTLFKREAVGAKFNSMKRWLLIRGDALLHVSADPLKPEGTRLRITELSPETYFPIVDRVDPERVVGCYLVNVIKNDEDEEIVQRIEYRRMLTEDDVATYGAPLGTVFYRLSFWTLEGWDDRYPRSEEDLEEAEAPAAVSGTEAGTLAMTGGPLDPRITAIPVYHFRNRAMGGKVFGVSELQGVETLLGGQTQVVTDQDIAVALQGIGVFWTDSGRPTNAQGDEVDWVISPATMLELTPGSKIGRVDGAKDINSMIVHTEAMGQHAREATGTPDVAVGRVDVKVAESGIALAIQFAPVTAKTEELEEECANKLDQMTFDLLNGWLPVYEGWNPNGMVVTVVFGDPLPVNRAAVIAEVKEMVLAKVISRRMGAQILKEKLGYDIDPAAMVIEVNEEDSASLDATGARMGQELGALTPPPTGDGAVV